MRKIFKSLVVFCIGIIIGFYFCNSFKIDNIFTNKYKAFQIGVYTDYDTAYDYSHLFKDSLIIQDNEIYRVYAAILKDQDNINNMAKYLSSNNIEYYIKDIEIKNNKLASDIREYENIMNNDNLLVFLEINKMIMEKYKESL